MEARLNENVGGFLKSEISSVLEFFLFFCQILINFCVERRLRSKKRILERTRNAIHITDEYEACSSVDRQIGGIQKLFNDGIEFKSIQGKSDSVVKVIPKHFPSLSDPTA